MVVPTSRTDRVAGSSELPAAKGYRHELGFYASDEDFRALIRPFALGGLEADQPVLFAYDGYKMDLLRSWLPDSPNISYITDTGPYASPSKALVAWRNVVEARLAGGASRVRIAGDVPHPGYGRSYAGWDRYEAAIDRVLGNLPVWVPCLYDTRVAPSEVQERATLLHQHVLEPDGEHRVNPCFQSPRRLADFLAPPADPLEQQTPVIELINPTAARVRTVIAALAEGVLSVARRDDLVLAASEIVCNAQVHGIPPVSVRVWLAGDRLLVSVHDEGEGPAEPLAGLLPADDERAGSGRGLWLTHQLDVDVALLAAPDGFTVKLSVGI